MELVENVIKKESSSSSSSEGSFDEREFSHWHSVQDRRHLFPVSSSTYFSSRVFPHPTWDNNTRVGCAKSSRQKKSTISFLLLFFIFYFDWILMTTASPTLPSFAYKFLNFFSPFLSTTTKLKSLKGEFNPIWFKYVLQF